MEHPMNRCGWLALLALCLTLACTDEVRVYDAGQEGPACLPGTLGCACAQIGDDLVCVGGVCDATTGLCRRALSCEELSCVQHQRCAPPRDGLDAACLDSCEPGFSWDKDRGRCVATDATCAPDDPRSIAAQCENASRECVSMGARRAACGGCLPGFVTDLGACRPLVRCAQLFCADKNRSCVEGDEHTDARCADCAEGTLETSAGVCVRQTCTHDADGASLGATCAAANRACVETDAGARCGECYAGYVEVGDRCEPRRDCEALRCDGTDRSCEVDAAGNARCGECRAGYREVAGVCVADPNATCDPAPAAGSILAACEAEHRACTGSACGDCLSGYYWDAARGACVESVSCSTCEAAHQDCVSENGANRCGACVEGYVVERATGACRPVRRCADITCAQGDVCVEATAHEDAFCRTDCGERGIFVGQGCVPCPACTAKDELGNPLELGFEPRATLDGRCICRTAPGYFYALGGEIGTFPCDADGDGWVRQSARVAYDLGDPVVRENARCSLRYIERFVLVNERGDRHEVPLDEPLPMFESDRNDDDLLLSVTWDRLDLPTDFDPTYVDPNGTTCTHGSECSAGEVCRGGHCTAVVSLTARALNPLTKYCHSVLTDYNDNGVADVEEWGARPTGRGEQQRVLNRFAYFAELHTGRWEPSEPESDRGAFVIRERTRAAGVGSAHVALTYSDASPGAHWRSCTVRRDVEWDRYSRPIGMDFASFEANPDAYLADDANPMWRGMNHHSQFKCVVVTSEPDAESPQELSVADALSPTRDLNACRPLGIEAPTDVNPAHPVFACDVRASAPTAGDVLWASVNYTDYPSAASLEGYVRGCVNGCAEARLRAAAHLSNVERWDCPTADYGLDNHPENLACTRDLKDQGKLVCLEACGDGLDNDGDGLLDADDLYFTDPVSGLDLVKDEACNTTLKGVCSTGKVGCEQRAGGAFTCIPDQTPSPNDLCDGLDNDCDGEVDEDSADPPAGTPPKEPGPTPAVGDACDDATQFGICRQGMLLCRDLTGGGRGLTCETVRPTGEPESCNGLDDDCDGFVDEVADLPPPFGTSCTPLDGAGKPMVGVCAQGEVRCVDGAQQCVQLGAAFDEGSPLVHDFMLCDTLDNDCDGQVDEGDTCVGQHYYDETLRPTTPTMGDREFDGHGPKVTVTVRHQLSHDGLWVELCADFAETQPDHSSARSCVMREVPAPSGRSIAMALSSDAKLVYVDTDHALDVLIDTSAVPTETLVEAQPGDLVSVTCVGDTADEDIGRGTNCRISGYVRYRVQPVAP